jgi:hypothetical protein
MYYHTKTNNFGHTQPLIVKQKLTTLTTLYYIHSLPFEREEGIISYLEESFSYMKHQGRGKGMCIAILATINRAALPRLSLQDRLI